MSLLVFVYFAAIIGTVLIVGAATRYLIKTLFGKAKDADAGVKSKTDTTNM